MKRNNEWYENVTIDTNWKQSDDSCHEMVESADILSKDDEEHIAKDTCLHPVDIAQEVLGHILL